MSEDEHFLLRWSRRKREVAKTTPAASVAKQEVDEPDANRSPDVARAKPPGESPERLVLDLATLPSIDSITAATDIRPFLAAGIPEELMHAALRRAWRVDPSIRDFVGLAENQWDFTAPGGAPGFGALLPADDLRQLVARVFGDEPYRQTEPQPPPDVTRETTTQVQKGTEESAAPPACGAAAQPADPVDDVTAQDGVRRSTEASKEQFIMTQKREEDGDNIAMQNHSTPDERKKRKHGSALPT